MEEDLEKIRWARIRNYYDHMMKIYIDGYKDLSDMDDESMHSVIENANLELQRIKELLE